MQFTRRFFANTFPKEQLTRQGPVREWLTVTESFIKNTMVLPLTQQFHPVYVAAAYLAFVKQQLTQVKAQKEAIT